MRVRIVVADECEARFYDVTDFSGELHPAGRMSDGRKERRRQPADQFAHQIAGRLEDALRHDCFDRLVVMANRPFLGTLRSEFSDRVREAVVAEVPKDLVHQPDGAVSVYVPKTAFEASTLGRRALRPPEFAWQSSQRTAGVLNEHSDRRSRPE